MGKTSEITAEQIARMRHNADMATACLMMCSINAEMRDGNRVMIHAFPWEVLDQSAMLCSLGAVSICAWQGRHMGIDASGYEHTWHWRKPSRHK